VKIGGRYIPEEKKPGRKVYDAYRAQIGVYLLLVEEQYGSARPTACWCWATAGG